MCPLLAIVYVSAARQLLAPADVERLLTRARHANARDGITGVLLHNDGNFMQYLEGPQEALLQAYQRIQQDRSHTGFIELLRFSPTERAFPNWALAYRDSPSCLALSVDEQDGEADLNRRLRCEAAPSSPAQLLLARFWGGGCPPGRSCSRSVSIHAAMTARAGVPVVRYVTPRPAVYREREAASLNRSVPL
jgi:hypothetical protein